MIILVVDGSVPRLTQTAELIRSTFPDSTVLVESDPLMAGKYVYNAPTDVVFAAWSMKRMDGPQLAAFIHRVYPEIRVVLTSCPPERAAGRPRKGEADALLPDPLTQQALRASLKPAL